MELDAYSPLRSHRQLNVMMYRIKNWCLKYQCWTDIGLLFYYKIYYGRDEREKENLLVKMMISSLNDPLTADGFISEKIDYSFILILRLRCVSQSMMDVYFAMAWKKNKKSINKFSGWRRYRFNNIKRVHQLVDSMLVAVRGPFCCIKLNEITCCSL